MAQWDFRGQYADEVEQILGAVYSENEFKIDGGKQQSRTRLYGVDAGDIAQYNISFSSPFTCLSPSERDWYLVLSCTAGNASFNHGGSSIDFSRGRVAAISTATESSMRGGATFAHISTLISTQAINAFCAKLLGHPIDQPVQFDLSAFDDELKADWRLVVRSLSQLLDAEHLPTGAINNLSEYTIALLLIRTIIANCSSGGSPSANGPCKTPSVISKRTPTRRSSSATWPRSCDAASPP